MAEKAKRDRVSVCRREWHKDRFTGRGSSSWQAVHKQDSPRRRFVASAKSRAGRHQASRSTSPASKVSAASRACSSLTFR
jgi:hypothetical protein